MTWSVWFAAAVFAAVSVIDPFHLFGELRLLPTDAAFPLAAALAGAAGAAVVARRHAWHAARTGWKQRLFDVADLASDGLLVCEGERIVALNRSMAGLLADGREEAEGRPLGALFPGMTVAHVPAACEMKASLRIGPTAIPVCLVQRPITIAGRELALVAVRDRREQVRLEAELCRLAETDPLTGLVNRSHLRVELSRRTASADPRGFALLLLGLDRFKPVNGAFGHDAGDALLVQVAGRIQAVLAQEAPLARRLPVARLGGDEFAVIVDDAAGPAAVRRIANDLIAAMSRTFLIDGRAFELGASVGIAIAPQDGATPDLIARHADLALHHAKQAGRGRAYLFDPAMAIRARDRRALEVALRRAVAEGQFEVHFQPQVDLASGMFDGAEALVRWRHPVRGLVLPGEFIAAAEDAGLINSIGKWVLTRACAVAAAWPSAMRVAVNLSPTQFRDPALARTIIDTLEESGLAPSRLEVEITENVLVDDEARTLATLTELRAHGVRVSIDDFGTGYSSLSYLRQFPFDKIKIDQSFVRLTPTDRGSSAIVRAVVTLAGSLGIETTAEGVETETQRRFVAAEGCTQGQGFLIGEAVPHHNLPDAFKAARRPLEATAA